MGFPLQEDWDDIHRIVLWLDHGRARDPQELLLRILKVQEEAGEVAEAVINVAGQNPRKPKTKDMADVGNELVDVAITAMVALESICPNNEVARQTFSKRLQHVVDRIPK